MISMLIDPMGILGFHLPWWVSSEQVVYSQLPKPLFISCQGTTFPYLTGLSSSVSNASTSWSPWHPNIGVSLGSVPGIPLLSIYTLLDDLIQFYMFQYLYYSIYIPNVLFLRWTQGSTINYIIQTSYDWKWAPVWSSTKTPIELISPAAFSISLITTSTAYPLIQTLTISWLYYCNRLLISLIPFSVCSQHNNQKDPV